MAKLLTHHDPYHVHAISGLMALLHFLYRFRLICLDVPQAGFGQSRTKDVVSMILLALPSVTSFVFQNVNIKKGSDGFSIWKEYRAHAFVYAAKLWLFMAVMLSGLDSFYVRTLAEFGTMIGLQWVTNQYPKQVSTIRGMYSSGAMVSFAGLLQFLARACMFYGPYDPSDMLAACFLGMFIVQLNAFNMTLRKKRIIGPKMTQSLYTTLLGSGVYLMLLRRVWQRPPTGMFDPGFKFVYLGIIAYACRRQGMDRFSSWILALSVMSMITQQFRLFDSDV